MKTKIVLLSNPFIPRLLVLSLCIGLLAYCATSVGSTMEVLALGALVITLAHAVSIVKSFKEGSLTLESGFFIAKNCVGRETQRWPLADLEECSIQSSHTSSGNNLFYQFFFRGQNEPYFSPRRAWIFSSPASRLSKWLKKSPELKSHMERAVRGGLVTKLRRPYTELHLGDLEVMLKDKLFVQGQIIQTSDIILENFDSFSPKLVTPLGAGLLSNRDHASLSGLLLNEILAQGLGGEKINVLRGNIWNRDLSKKN